MKTHVLIGHNPNLIMLLVETETDLNLWVDGGQFSRAQGAAPVQMHLKPGAAYALQRQFPFCQETREGLSKIIRRLKQQNPYCSTAVPVILQSL
jgi:hypothetical protein